MRIVIDSPTRASLVDATPIQLDLARAFLTFHDKSVDFQIVKVKNNRRWRDSDPATWSARLEELKAQRQVCILHEPDDRDPWTYSGLAQELSQLLNTEVVNLLVYPEATGVAWEKVPEHQARPYQLEAKRALLEAKHGGVEIGTGLGKSRIILEMVHDLGRQTVVMAPSRNIAHQLHRDFVKHLGKRNVGMYGDGKKELKKFTIAIAASLTRIEPETEAWKWFAGTEVFVSDESHLLPAVTFEKVAMGLMANAPYRFSFSATQTRIDGSEIVLRGITGPIVHNMTVKEGVDGGYLAKPIFKMIKVPSRSSYESTDIQRMTRVHFLENPDIIAKACQIANLAVSKLGHQVVILIDELSQFRLLEAQLKHPVRFAHGQDNTAEAKKVLPKEYWRSDPTDLVDRFNANEFPILIGTSCIATGTDIQNVRTCIMLTGGKSEIAVSQAVGRCTRRGALPDGSKKAAANVVDFAPILRTSKYDDTTKSISPLYRHALARAKIYESIYPSLSWM